MITKPSPVEPATHLRRIPILECGEPLIDILERCAELYWVPRHPVFAYRRIRVVREGIAERLAVAARALPAGMRLAIVEGWRAPQIQAQMRQATWNRLAAQHPDWPKSVLTREVNRWSAPIDPKAPPPHTTGAAVDVHLVDARGVPLDTVSPYGILDPRAAASEPKGLSETARRNRAILRDAMLGAGFTNYPIEWWHWSHGDQAWAYRGGHAQAIYGQTAPPEAEGADFTFTVHEVPGF